MEQEQLNKLLSAKNSVGLLLNQQMQMTNEENELQQKISALQLILEENKINPETNQEYLDLTLAHNEIKRKLTEIESRLAYLKSHPESQEYQKNKRHFIEVIGFSDVISKNRDLIVKKSLTLDTDLNEIEAQKVVLERLLQKKIGLLNQAKKEKAKLEKQKLELIAQNTEINDADVLLANHLTSLAERGRIHEKNTLIQARINLERNRLTNSIANLAEFKTYSDYQAEIQKLEASDLKLSQRKEKLDEMLINAQYKLLHEQKIIKEECENSKKFFLELEQIILTLISGFEHQAIFGLENVRKI